MANATGANFTYCNLKNFEETYKYMHGPFSIVVCVFGSIANILNICVLTTKDMRWPTNYILTSLAVTDLLVMIEYIPFAVHRYIDINKRYYIDHYTYNWAVFMVFHAVFTMILHFVSCCLTVILAVWRYIAVSQPQNIFVWCNSQRTKLTIFLTYVLCPLICLPLFLPIKVNETSHLCDKYGRFVNAVGNNSTNTYNMTIYLVDNEKENYRYISFLTYGVVLKLAPCILLSVLSYGLIRALMQTKKRRRLLLDTSLPLDVVNEKTVKKQRQLEKEQQTDRTTRMLLAVLLLFLITEFPQAILGLSSVLIGEQFEKDCYRPLGKYILYIFLACCISNVSASPTFIVFRD